MLLILAVATALLLAALAVLANLQTDPLAQSLVWVTNTNRVINPADDPSSSTLKAQSVDQALRVDVGPPAASLSVWIMEPREGSLPTGAKHPRGCIVLLHGINADKASNVGVGQRFTELGYRAILVDLRAHGRSSGQWCTFGVREKQDLTQLLDALSATGLVNAPVGVMSPSLGGAVAIQWAALDPRIKAVVAIDTFSSYRAIVPGYVRKYLPVVGWMMLHSTIERAIDRAGQVADFNPDDASPIDAIQKTKCPVLLIHGLADRHIAFMHSVDMNNAAPDHTKLELIPGAEHNTVMGQAHYPAVMASAEAWFGEHLHPQ
ncbi:MAG: alpha/beta fold hydrolase [Planctomycetota bacterium]|nr:alpha/beta fold hydrolase [Planctomycetota bacterium]